jgi:membrane associated rhomboid family serine protease
VIPAEIVSGHGWITIVTAMFMHASWLHIIGNMIFFWAFGPEIEDAMGRGRFLVFYLLGGLVAMLAQVAAAPTSELPNLGASGAIAAVMGAFLVTYPRDRIKTALFFLIFVRIAFVPASLLIGFWFLMQLFSAGAVTQNVQTGGGSVPCAHRRVSIWGDYGEVVETQIMIAVRPGTPNSGTGFPVPEFVSPSPYKEMLIAMPGRPGYLRSYR